MTVGTDVKSCYITIKNAEATLLALSLSSTSAENKASFEAGRQILVEVKDDLHKQVLYMANSEPQYK